MDGVLVALAGVVVGALLGVELGLLGGLGWTALADTPCFEGLCGYVVALWMLFSLLLGAIIGPWVALRILRWARGRA